MKRPADDRCARAVLPGHVQDDYVLAKHSWDEPYQRLAAASEGRAWRLLDAQQGEPVWSPIRRNHLTPGGAKRQCSIRGEHMTISAQVIDTIVEWIDDNLHQPLRIDDIARHAGYSKWHLQRLFLQYKGESLGRYIRERKLLAPAICATPISGSTIRASSMALIRNRPLPASLPDLQSAAGRLPQREPQSRPLRRASWFNARGKTSDATPSAAPDTQWRPAPRTTDKNAPYRAG